MGILTDWFSTLRFKRSADSASDLQSKTNQGDADAKYKLPWWNANSREPYDLDLCRKDIEAPPVIKLVNYILEEAIKRRASDIYMEPTTTFFMFSIRVDGILHDLIGAPPRLQNAVIDRVKFMAKLDIAEKRLPQDGRISVRVGGRGLDLRVSTIPDRYGEKVVIQIPDSANVRPDGDNQKQPGWDKMDVDELMREFFSSIFRMAGVP